MFQKARVTFVQNFNQQESAMYENNVLNRVVSVCLVKLK